MPVPVGFVPFNDIIQNPYLFQDLVRSLADRYVLPDFTQYTDSQYSESREWKAVTALNGRIPMASLIDPYSGKPIIGSEKPLDLFGELPTFGNKVVFTSKEFNKIAEIERGIMQNIVNPAELLKYVNTYIRRLQLGPLISVNKLFYEAWSNGTSTISSADNLAKLSMSIDWGINKETVSVSWTDTANADGIKDLVNFYFSQIENGNEVTAFTMNRKTFNLLVSQTKVRQYITSVFSSVSPEQVRWTGVPNINAINTILSNNFNVPVPIVIKDAWYEVYNEDGVTIKGRYNAFADNRVAATVAPIIARYIWTPADEQRRPDFDAVYQAVNNVLISKRGKRGAVTFESELNAFCVPTQLDQMSILQTDQTPAT